MATMLNSTGKMATVLKSTGRNGNTVLKNGTGEKPKISVKLSHRTRP